MFQAVYDSPWLATVALAATSLAGLVVWLRRGSFLAAYVVLFTIVALGDALRSGSWSPLHLLASPWEDQIGMAFVLLGDYRYFLLVERYRWRPDAGPREATRPIVWGTSFVWTAIVPLITLTLQKAVPVPFADSRWTYLTYELLFIVLVTTLRFVVLRRQMKSVPATIHAWLLDATRFELAVYGLWALSDVVILWGVDAGFLLRIVPNVLYYGLFVPFVAFRAPAEVTG